ncbi:MAG: amidohydrolase family protein [Vicinamibacterales bacterium]
MRNAVLIAGLTVWAAAGPAGQGPDSRPPAEAQYEIRLIARVVGTDHVRYSAAAGGERLDSRLEIVDRGTPLGVDSSLTVGADLAPRAFEARGRLYRFVHVDAAASIENGTATFSSRGASGRAAVTGPAFLTRGYAPLAGRAWLVGYWERQGRPEHIVSLPAGQAGPLRVRFEGDEMVRAGGRAVHLRRYTVDGVVWGREAVWLDDHGRLAALVTRVHILPLEAIRTDLREAFAQLQASAVRDRMRDLEAMRAAVRPVASGDFAITGATVIGGAGRPLPDATLVVRDGRIAGLGPRASTPVPEAMRTIEATGAVIVPGLWEMHAHASQIEWAPAYLAAGVTTVRDMGGELGYLTALRDTLDTGRGLGPRMLLAGLVDGAGEGGFGAVTAASPDEGRAVADRYHEAGFDQLKLYTLLAPDVVSAIAAHAHRLGMGVTGHVPRALTPQQGVERGMDQIAHLPVRGGPDGPGSRALIAALGSRRTVVDPTLSWTELLGRGPAESLDAIDPEASRLPPALAENYRSVANARATDLAPALASVKALADAGVRIVAGTDGALPGLSLVHELELFVRAGFTPQEALDAATRVPAAAMGRLDDIGTLETGKRADLLVLEASPLDDIGNLRRRRWVAVGGALRLCRSGGPGGVPQVSAADRFPGEWTADPACRWSPA